MKKQKVKIILSDSTEREIEAFKFRGIAFHPYIRAAYPAPFPLKFDEKRWGVTHLPTGMEFYVSSQKFKLFLVGIIASLFYPMDFELGDECKFKEFISFANKNLFSRFVRKYWPSQSDQEPINAIKFCEVSADFGKECIQ
jgi:hypothetical protein